MTMIWYEIKKILLRPSYQIALLLILVLAGQSCFEVLYGRESLCWFTEDGQEQHGYAAVKNLREARKEWSGTLDQQMLEKALAELKLFDQEGKNHPEDPNYAFQHTQGLIHIRELLNRSYNLDYVWDYKDYFLAETIEQEQLPHFYENRITQLKNWLYDEDSAGYQRFSNQEKEYLIRNYESLETPFEVGYTAGWDQAFSASYYVILYGTLLMAFLVSGIFSNESRWRADSIYFSTELGRKNGTKAKLTAGFLLTTVVYWVVMGMVNLLVLGLLGFDGARCPIQADFHNWDRIYNITVSQRSLLALLDGYLLWLFICSMVMLVSALSGSAGLAVTVPSLLMLGTAFLDRRGFVKSIPYKVLMMFPHKMASAYGNEPIMLYNIFGNIMPPIIIQRILYSGLTVLMVILCYQIFRRKQVC